MTLHAYEVADDQLVKGWCVEVNHTAPSGKVIPSYWYGPDHGFGTTSGGLDWNSHRIWAWWPTRKAAEADLRKIGRRPHFKPRRVAEVLPNTHTEEQA